MLVKIYKKGQTPKNNRAKIDNFMKNLVYEKRTT